MKNYFIIHGTKESPYGHWYPWMYLKLTNAGETCVVPHFPDEGNYKQWKKVVIFIFLVKFRIGKNQKVRAYQAASNLPGFVLRLQYLGKLLMGKNVIMQ